MTDLVFRVPVGGTDLVFGTPEPVEGDLYRVSVSGLFPPLTAAMRVAIAYGARVHAVLPDITAHAVASYRSEVSRPVVGNLLDDAGAGVAVAAARADRAAPADRRQGGARFAYGEGITLQSNAGVAWQDAAYRDSTLRAVFEDATGVGHPVRTAYQHAIATHQIFASAFEEAQREARHLGAGYQDALRHARLRIGGAYQEAGRQSSMLAAAGHVASPASHARRHRYQEAMSPRRGVRAAPVIPPRGCYTPPLGGAVHLLFGLRRSAGAEILFRCGSESGIPAGAIVIPTLRAYIVVNSATLTRVSNNLRLPLRDISISGDADSVHWAWSATLPLRSLADLEPDMPGQLVELEARLNDMPWRLLVEKRTESERFGSGSLRISGRGVAAELSAPGAASTPRNNLLSAQTAQQLAADALTINGVSSGWTLTWQGADWLLPAGLWAHTGTPMEAVLRLAEAGGAYVLPSPAARSLAVLPRYPAAPWEWASLAPGVVLPAAATLERGSEEFVRPGSNIVFVCGRNLNARVRRTGSAGDRPAQMIVDPLTAHADAARQRGLAALAEASSHRMWQLETGILQGYGVIQIGTVLDWVRGETTRRGIVRGLAVAASLPSGASKDPVKVRQTLGVEIHG